MKKENDKNYVGLVASGSRRTEMQFYSSEPISVDFVSVRHSDPQVRTVYEVTDVDVYNKRLEDIDFIRYITPGEDYGRYNIYRAKAAPMVTIDEKNNCFADKRFLAPPGCQVEKAKDGDVAKAYGVEPGENKVQIGALLKDSSVDVFIDTKALLTTHMAVVGRSGQGKSNFTKILLGDLKMKYLLFTPANEYFRIEGAEHNDVNDIRIPPELSIYKKIYDLSSTEVRYLREYMREKGIKTEFTSAELSEDILYYFWSEKKTKVVYQQGSLFEEKEETVDMKQLPQYVVTLCKKLESRDLIADREAGNYDMGSSAIFNLQQLSRENREIFIYQILNRLLESRLKLFKELESGPEPGEQIAVILEEAHNYVPSNKSSFCKAVINEIAREGRKLGIHLILLSQRPRFMDPTTLSQCGSIVSFHIANPEDIDYLMASANFYGDYYKKLIQELKTGECYMVSDYLPKGIGTKVNYFQPEPKP